MNILLVRHGETDNNRLGMSGIVGNDAPLIENGRSQAIVASEITEDFRPTTIFSSPFLRCRQTAEVIANDTRAKIEVTESLEEFDMGDWANMESEDTKTLLMQHNAWDYSPSKFAFRVPGGESWEDVALRVKLFLKNLSNTDEETVVLVSHNATIRAFVGIMRGAHFKDWFGFPFPNGAVSAFEYKAGHYKELFINKQELESNG
jgi:probable phosphoglycerate mutase